MKTAAFIFAPIFALLTSVAAQAVVLPDGSFVPGKCGAQTGLVGHVQAVCVGNLVGDSARIFQFRLADKTTRLFKVADQQNLMIALMSGNTKSVLFLEGVNGEKTTMKVIQTPQGEIVSVQGDLDQVGYFVPKFEEMVVAL